MVWCWPWSSLCWGHLSSQSPWILSYVFLCPLVLFLELCHIAHHPPVVVLWLLHALIAALWILLLLHFPRCLSISPVHIPYCPSSFYTIKKKFNVCSTVFLRVDLVLLPRVLIQCCITLKLYFSKMNSAFINTFLRIFSKSLWTKKEDHLIPLPDHINILFPQFFSIFFLFFRNTPVPSSFWWMPGNRPKFFIYLCFLSLTSLITICAFWA